MPSSTSTSPASSDWRRRLSTRKRTRSPGNAPSMKTALPSDSGNAAAVVGEIHDVGLLDLARLQVPGHAAENSLKCAAGESSQQFSNARDLMRVFDAFKWPRNSSNRR